MIEFLLFNGFTPLRRSPADVFLDNGLGVLESALQMNNISYEIEDRATLPDIATFNLPTVSRPLRQLFEKHLFSSESLTQPEQAQLQHLYTELLSHHQKKMRHYLSGLALKIQKKNIPAVGIKLWAGSTYQYCVSLCQQIHAVSPDTIVIAGGPQVNCFASEGHILRLSPFDVAVYSEGENALIQILKAIQHCSTRTDRLAAIANAAIPNTIYRNHNQDVVKVQAKCTDIQQKPTPLYRMREGVVPVHTIIDALGCDYGKCTFCIHPKISPGFRRRSPEKIVDEMAQMIQQEIGLFSFTASDTPLSHGVQISEEILKRRLKLEFTMLSRAQRNAANRQEKIIKQFRTLIRAGLKSVFFGVESGSDAVLEHVMNKGVSTEDMAITMACLRTASKLENTQVNIIASFIFPVPLPSELTRMGITSETVMEDNLKFLQRIKPDSFHAAPGLLYPGTDWYSEKARFQIEFDESSFLPKWITQEFSYHGFLAPPQSHLYTFNDIPLQEMIPASMAFARRGNALGIPSDLWDEHFIFARANGIEGANSLQKISRELFLDLLTCNDENTRHLYEGTIRHSRAVAAQNRL
ncbi:MAG: radical SAM protein [Deltaproteobacteria bacterium]|nr:radical SAM protein [Deltaproteobacteria bacterium]